MTTSVSFNYGFVTLNYSIIDFTYWVLNWVSGIGVGCLLIGSTKTGFLIYSISITLTYLVYTLWMTVTCCFGSCGV